MLESGRNKIEELKDGNVDVKYNDIPEEETWRVEFIREVIELRHGDLELPGISQEEL